MHVLVVHNRYAMRGGEDAVAEAEIGLLRAHGHRVSTLFRSNEAVSRAGWIRSAAGVAWNRQAYRDVRAAVRATGCDIVHVHNFFPLLSPSVFAACRDERVPVVHTLHNYRLLCAAATLFRDGRPCEACVRGSPYRAVLHGCYRGSRLASLPTARMIDQHRRRETWSRDVDRFIAPTAFLRDLYGSAGLPADRISLKPNFVTDLDRPPANSPDPQREGALYVGRLSAEKGIATLIEAWSGLAVPLTVLGDGPMAARIRAAHHPGIRWQGWASAQEVVACMLRARFLVMPSLWFEGLPLVLLEAFRCGLPVIASRLGAMAEVVEDGRTGLLAEPGSATDLRSRVLHAEAHPQAMAEMGRQAREAYCRRYTPESNYRRLVEIYAAAAQA